METEDWSRLQAEDAKMAAKPPAAGREAENRFSLPGLRRTSAADALISDLRPGEP